MPPIVQDVVGNTKVNKMTQTNDYGELLDAWGNLLDVYDWDQFCTFTYSASVWCQEKVARDFKRMHYIASANERGVSKNNRTHRYNSRNELLPPYIHKSGTLHAHALVGFRDNASNGESHENTISKRNMELAWQENICNAGFTSISPVRESTAARSYIVKTSRYCVKNPDAYLDWYGLGKGMSALPVASDLFNGNC